MFELRAPIPFLTYPLGTKPLTNYFALIDPWCGPLGSINILIYYNTTKPFDISCAYITTRREESIMGIQHDPTGEESMIGIVLHVEIIVIILQA